MGLDVTTAASDATNPDIEPETKLVAGPAREPAFRLAALYHGLCQLGHHTAAAHLLTTASLALPAFAAEASRRHAPAPQRLAAGPAEAALVCFPDFFPQIADIRVYRTLAAELNGEQDVFEIAYPVAAVPEDFATLASMHAETVRKHFAGRPVVLVGFSAGGCTAQAVAALLGSHATGLIMIDTYPPTKNDIDWLLGLPAAMTSRAGSGFQEVVSDTALAAMGTYFRIIVGWLPGPCGAPTLFLRARDRAPQIPEGEEWHAQWPQADQTTVIPGNHLTLLDEHVQTTAAAIRSWITRCVS